MFSKRIILQNLLIFLLFVSPIALLAKDGYWKLSEIKSENKGLDKGSLKNFVAGEPEKLVYTHEFSAGGWKVQATWGKLPEILIPEKEVTVGYQVDIIDYKPPKYHWEPVVGIYFNDFRPADSFDKKIGRGSLGNLRAEPKKLEHGKEKITINPPQPGKDNSRYYIIKMSYGSGSGRRTYYYIYKWQEGSPSVEIDEVKPIHAIWKLTEVKSENKGLDKGSLKNFVEGEPEKLVYTHEFSAGGWKVQATWGKLPEILMPEKEVTVGYQVDIIDYKPPKYHWSPVAGIYFNDYRPAESFDKKIGRGSLGNLRAEPKKLDHGKEEIRINPPQPDKDNSRYYIIKMSFGSGSGWRTYYYIYEWQE